MERKWNLNDFVNKADLSLDDMVNAIYVFETLKNKYTNDEFIDAAIEILRNEICGMFGGSIYHDENN